MREAVAGFPGDLDKVYGIGAWWWDVLSLRAVVVRLSREGGRLTRLVPVSVGVTVEIDP